jgi:galactofuranosylgalactofuranosylrhamnosyl-N-acetylglucosaminyl-diphospho-decaprenol beta-1,5/1,6-galactofuranosyltransferase
VTAVDMTQTLDDQSQNEWQTLQRVILPPQAQMDTVPLYVDMGTAAGVQIPTTGESTKRDKRPRTISSPAREAHAEDFLSRVSMMVRPGERVSFGTYFNAFPASYWRRWTTIDSVRLSVTTSGAGAVVVYKSNARGSLQRVDSQRVEGDVTTAFDLSLKPFGDGGWYWFDVVAAAEPVAIRRAEWQASGEARSEAASLSRSPP